MDLGRYGIREVANVTFRPLKPTDFGDQHFDKMQPCLFMDTATVSSFEGTATTVYARGGQGNPKRIAWDGEKEVTVTFTDALLSTISLAMLSGASVSTGNKAGKKRVVHEQYDGFLTELGTVVQNKVSANKTLYCYGQSIDNPAHATDPTKPEKIADTSAPRAYAYLLDETGGVKHVFTGYVVGVQDTANKTITWDLGAACRNNDGTFNEDLVNSVIRIDYYAQMEVGITEFNIAQDVIAGNYYIEADALFRDEESGVDFPATFIIPRGKIQSSWNLSMQNSGDPSTFEFKIDAMPGFIRGQQDSGEEAKQVLMAIQIQEPGTDDSTHDWHDNTIHGHSDYAATAADAVNGTQDEVDYIDIWDTNYDTTSPVGDLNFQVLEKDKAVTGSQAQKGTDKGSNSESKYDA